MITSRPRVKTAVAAASQWDWAPQGLGDFTITPGAGGGYTPSLPAAPALAPGGVDPISPGTYPILSQMIWGGVVGPGSAPVQGAVRQGYYQDTPSGLSTVLVAGAVVLGIGLLLGVTGR